jgi:hypothetical protein
LDLAFKCYNEVGFYPKRSAEKLEERSLEDELSANQAECVLVDTTLQTKILAPRHKNLSSSEASKQEGNGVI